MFVCACKFALFDKSTLCDGTDNITKEVREPDVRVKIKRISPKCVLFQHFYSENLLKYYQSVSYCNTKISWSCYNSHFYSPLLPAHMKPRRILCVRPCMPFAVAAATATADFVPISQVGWQSDFRICHACILVSKSSACAKDSRRKDDKHTHKIRYTDKNRKCKRVRDRTSAAIEGVRAKRVNRRNMALLQHYKPWIWK